MVGVVRSAQYFRSIEHRGHQPVVLTGLTDGVEWTFGVREADRA